MDIRYCFVLWCCFMAECHLQEPTGKIDFDDSTHNVSPNIQIVKTLKTVTSCSYTGCNTTQNTNNDNSNSSVNTEILVHVQTKVNLNQNQNKSVGSDLDEVPVLFGCKGQQRCSPNFDSSYDRSRNSYYEINNNAGYRPPTENKQQSFFPPWLESRSYSNSPESHGYFESNFGQNNENLDSYNGPRTHQSFSPNDYPSLVSPPQFPPSARPVQNNYGNNQEIHIPYFSHSNKNHHFNEDPPLVAILHNNRNSHNPVEFRSGPTNQWRPIFGINRNHKHDFIGDNQNFINPSNNPGLFRHYQHQPTQRSHNSNIFQRNENGLECFCRKSHTDLDTAATNVDGSTSCHGIKLNRKNGGFIDDKLAPLN